MKKKVDLECTGCDTKYSVSFKCEEDVRELDPIMCPFCGEEVFVESDAEEDDEYDGDTDDRADY